MHVRKAALICDKCGEKLEIDPTIDNPFYSSIMQQESEWKDWILVDGTHHLCPACASEYNKRKAEMEAELKELAGIKTIDFDM